MRSYDKRDTRNLHLEPVTADVTTGVYHVLQNYGQSCGHAHKSVASARACAKRIWKGLFPFDEYTVSVFELEDPENTFVFDIATWGCQTGVTEGPQWHYRKIADRKSVGPAPNGPGTEASKWIKANTTASAVYMALCTESQ